MLMIPRHRHQRLQWCRTRLSWRDSEWQRVIFSDESRFSLGGDAQRTRVWRHRGQHQDERFVVTRPEGLVSLHLHPYRTICRNCVRMFKLQRFVFTRPGGPLSCITFPRQEEEYLHGIVGSLPYILVLGQDCSARYQLLNCLLGERLLPLGSDLGGACGPEGESCKRRKLRFTHGRQTRLSLALPGQYELVHQLAAHCGRWDTVPRQDLEIQEECEDPAHRLAELEITLHHALLQLPVIPSSLHPSPTLFLHPFIPPSITNTVPSSLHPSPTLFLHPFIHHQHCSFIPSSITNTVPSSLHPSPTLFLHPFIHHQHCSFIPLSITNTVPSSLHPSPTLFLHPSFTKPPSPSSGHQHGSLSFIPHLHPSPTLFLHPFIHHQHCSFIPSSITNTAPSSLHPSPTLFLHPFIPPSITNTVPSSLHPSPTLFLHPSPTLFLHPSPTLFLHPFIHHQHCSFIHPSITNTVPSSITNTVPSSLYPSPTLFLHPFIPPSITNTVPSSLHSSIHHQHCSFIPSFLHSSPTLFLHPFILLSITNTVPSSLHPFIHHQHCSFIPSFFYPSPTLFLLPFIPSSITNTVPSSLHPFIHHQHCSFIPSFITNTVPSFITNTVPSSITNTVPSSLHSSIHHQHCSLTPSSITNTVPSSLHQLDGPGTLCSPGTGYIQYDQSARVTGNVGAGKAAVLPGPR
ncbi:hypothetical protein NFI96_004531 [Prochilodus magdalenae]|nr:hypothetical protein NFI96_004531 [Prochilodus magdalenae]